MEYIHIYVKDIHRFLSYVCGSIFIMLAGSFGAAFGIDNDTSFLINLVPLILFIVVCLVGKPDTQIMMAQLLSIGYALVMMAVLVGLLVQIGDTSTQTKI